MLYVNRTQEVLWVDQARPWFADRLGGTGYVKAESVEEGGKYKPNKLGG